MKKYLLSTGRSTYLVEYYIMDLIKLYLQVFPGDIPGNGNIGFDFIISNTMKEDLPKAVEKMMNNLVSLIQSKFNSGISIAIESINVIDEKHASVTITINRNLSEDVLINLSED